MKNKARRILVIILALLLILSLLASTIVSAAMGEQNEDILVMPIMPNGDPLSGESVLKELITFEEKFPTRHYGTSGELAAADYLKELAEGLGYTPKNDDFYQKFSWYQEGLTANSGTLHYSQNVVAIKEAENNATDKKVIIGAHYDNYSNDGSSKGAYDNGTGVASLISIMKALKDQTFNFDIEFVFFGMEEIGLIGSSEYVAKMTEEDIENTLVMINLDVVGMGEYLYLFTDEIERTHEGVFFEAASANDAKLRKMPKDKKSYISFGNTSSFIHLGHQSDHRPFMQKDIPVAFFFGYNLETNNPYSGAEKEGASNTMHNELDNTAHLINLYGEAFVADRLEDVVNIVVLALKSDSFASEMIYSKQNNPVNNIFYSPIFSYGVAIGIVVIFILLLLFVVNKEKKEKPTVVISSEYTSTNVFYEETEEKKQKPQDDDDDVFGL